MVGVVWRMISVRRAHAITVFLLAVLATGAAVAAPVFLTSARASLVQRELDLAAVPERYVSAQELVQVGHLPYDQRTKGVDQHGFERQSRQNVEVPGFQTVLSVNLHVVVGQRPPTVAEIVTARTEELQYRENLCAEVTFVSGRCFAGPGEVVLTPQVAQELKLAVGDPLLVTPVTIFGVAGERNAKSVGERNGETTQFNVVGLYTVRDPDDLYWGLSTGLPMRNAGDLPMFTGRVALNQIPHNVEEQITIAYPPAGALTADTLEDVRAGVASALRRNAGGILTSSQLGTLLSRIDLALTSVATAPFVGAVLLIVLCWFVIFLAVAQAAQNRRSELGMMKLRGLTLPDQWWLAVAETAVPLCAGAVAGYFAAHGTVWLLADEAGRAAIHVGWRPLPYAAIALAGATLVSLAALRQDLGRQAVELMRRVPARGNAWQGATLLVVPAVLAVVAVFQARTSDPTDPNLLVLFAPALTILALSMLAAVAFDAVLGAAGTRLLRRGRLGLGLGALHFGRRNSGSRLLGLLTVAVALLGFASIGTDAAADRRQRQIDLDIGAPQVLQIGAITPLGLLDAVHDVDPEGHFAMAVVRQQTPNGGPILAVDANALAATTFWPRANDRSASDVATLLRPQPVPEPVIVQGSRLRLSATVDLSTGGIVVLQAKAMPLDGREAAQIIVRLDPGTHSYDFGISCATGCRFGDIALSALPDASGTPGDFSIVLHELRQLSPAAVAVTSQQFGQWVDREGRLDLVPGADGLTIRFPSGAAGQTSRVSPPDTPEALPVIGSAPGITSPLAGTSDQVIRVVHKGGLAAIPRIGNGRLVDLAALSRADDSLVPTTAAEVWLAADAPADSKDRLAAAGLSVLTERSEESELAAAARSPSAIGLGFFLAVAALGLVLGLAGLLVSGSLERGARADELRSLRAQGLRRRVALASGLWSYLITVGAAVVLGAAIGKGAWALTGAVVPTGEANSPEPPPLTYLGANTLNAWIAAAVLLLALSVGLVLTLMRSVGRTTRASRSA